jgi:Bacterial Ig-like domain
MRRALAALGSLAALAAAGHGVRASQAAFIAPTKSNAATFSTAADWILPAVTLTAPADGSYSKTTTVTLSGAAGTATGDSTTVTLNIYSGSAATGTPVLTRPVTRSGATWSTSVTTLGQGTYTAQVTQADSGGNTGKSATRTFTIDTTAPTRGSIAADNGTGTPGHLDAGDTITFTYSEPMLASSILSGWSGVSAATVDVRLFKGTNNAFTVLDSANAANVKLDAGTTNGGGVSLADPGYVTNTVNFTATLTQSADKRSFVVRLGSPDNASRVVATPVAARNMVWTPKAGPTDLAGNALASTATDTETDSDQDF